MRIVCAYGFEQVPHSFTKDSLAPLIVDVRSIGLSHPFEHPAYLVAGCGCLSKRQIDGCQSNGIYEEIFVYHLLGVGLSLDRQPRTLGLVGAEVHVACQR